MGVASGFGVCVLWFAAEARAERGLLVQVQDSERVLGTEVVVRLTGTSGDVRTLQAADDGNIPDVSAGDGVWTAPLPSVRDTSGTVRVESGGRSWELSTELPMSDEKPFLRLAVSADGSIREASEPLPGTGGGGGGAGGEFRPLSAMGNGGGAQMSMQQPMQQSTPVPTQSLIFPSALGGATIGLAVGALALRALRVRPVRLVAPQSAPTPPVRLSADQVADALAGPLAGMRVVCLGPAPNGARVIRPEERGALPAELVAAVERLAATPGPSPALLITDPGALDRTGRAPPARVLARAVDGRFPLYVVDGPEEWAAYVPAVTTAGEPTA
jgi:hypothetical protein